MFNKILIANRGEIACRIIKTCHSLGIHAVAIYSTADQHSLHVRQADSAFWVGEAEALNSYLNIAAIIRVALASGAEAIHPGYGFLSENPAFAKACDKAKLVFIGPSISALQIMGSKQTAKQLLAQDTSVPLIPGYHDIDQTDARLLQEAKLIGFPVLLKAANGGGGKGMRAVYQEADFLQALQSARREAMTSFADDTMLIEKLVANPRHVEVQIMADNHGQVLHLFERDCSIQRRHQKIIEEAPAPGLSPELRENLAQSACEVARAIHYQGAGTVEFLVGENNNFYFMEMNTRLQVEHPVTEMITGLDLVAWQINIAANIPLAQLLSHDAVVPLANQVHGHAIECRIYAEDAAQDFIPSTGEISFLQEPQGKGIRIDSGISEASAITRYYDPMLAKLIAWGETRAQALRRLQLALDNYIICGVKTNIPFLRAICNHPRFVAANFNTQFLQQEDISIELPDMALLLSMAASYDYLTLSATTSSPLSRSCFAWQMHVSSYWFWQYNVLGQEAEIKIIPLSLNAFILESAYGKMHVYPKLQGKKLILENAQRQFAYIEERDATIIIYLAASVIAVERCSKDSYYNGHVIHKVKQLTAPMPGTIVAILKNIGDKVTAGEGLVILEAMKMEHTIYAPKDGILAEIFYEIGAQVNEGAELLSLK